MKRVTCVLLLLFVAVACSKSPTAPTEKTERAVKYCGRVDTLWVEP